MRGLMRMVGSLFFDSPLSRAGAAIATLAGLAYGFPLARGRVERQAGLLICRIPSWAYPRGGMTVGRVFLTGARSSEAIYRHERVHVRQWQRYGLLFPLLYWSAGRAAHRNRFEVEAGLVDGGYVPPDTDQS